VRLLITENRTDLVAVIDHDAVEATLMNWWNPANPRQRSAMRELQRKVACSEDCSEEQRNLGITVTPVT
jgi:hypothetical protein